MNKKVNIAVVGLGNIGSYFCNEIVRKKKDILLKSGTNLNLFRAPIPNREIVIKIFIIKT